MFEIVCEVANTSGKTLTIETSIPEAEKPDVQILKSGQQMGIFASQTGSTVKITVVSVEATDRIEKLETALREVLSLGDWGANILARTIILEALETTDCLLGNKDENP